MLIMSDTLGDIVYPFPFNQLLPPKGENVDPSLPLISPTNKAHLAVNKKKTSDCKHPPPPFPPHNQAEGLFL